MASRSRTRSLDYRKVQSAIDMMYANGEFQYAVNMHGAFSNEAREAKDRAVKALQHFKRLNPQP